MTDKHKNDYQHTAPTIQSVENLDPEIHWVLDHYNIC